MLTQENLASNARTLARLSGASRADDVLIHALPIFHTHGLFVATNVVLAAGGSMIFLPQIRRRRGHAAAAAGDRADGRADLLYAAAAAARPDARGDARTCASSSPARRRCWPRPTRPGRRRTGHAILERYGMTETNMNTSNPYDGDRIAGTVGFAAAGGRAAHRRPGERRRLPQGEIGMIEVKGPNVFEGYWRMPEKTQAEFRADGFFITGDLGTIDARGYVHIVGPRQGPDHHRRLQRLSQGGRERDRRAARGRRERGDRRAAPGFRRGGDGGGGRSAGAQLSTRPRSSRRSTGGSPGSSCPSG